MRTSYSILILFLLCSFIQQDSLPEPEFSSRPYYLKEGQLVNLERVDALYEVKILFLGYGGSEAYYTAFLPTSTVRFKKESLPRLFIKLEGKVDVSDNPILLYVGQMKKDRRRFKVASQALGGKARDVTSAIITPTLKKIREGLYEIIFENGLLPGEYAFSPISPPDVGTLSNTAKIKICCFTVY